MVLSADEIKKEIEDTKSYTGSRDEMASLNVLRTDDLIGSQNSDNSSLINSVTAKRQHEQHLQYRDESGIIDSGTTDTECDQQVHRSNSGDGETASFDRDPETGKDVVESESCGSEGGEEEASPAELGKKLTNFSIDQILRTDFGPKCRHQISDVITRERVRLFPASPMVMSSPSQLFSHDSLVASPPASTSILSSTSRLLSSTLFSAFSSPVRRSGSAFSPKQPSAKLSRGENYFYPGSLTPPPSSPESASSSSPPSSSRRALTSSKRDPTPTAQCVTSVTSSSLTSSVTESALDLKTDAASSSKSLRWPAWVYCTRYSDRPSSGPRYRKPRQTKPADKRPRTAFSANQLNRLRQEFQDCPYLSETRRISLAKELGLSESQVKIWFQNKRAKLKKGYGVRNPLAQLLMEEGLYNHSTIVVRNDDIDNSDNIGGNIINNCSGSVQNTTTTK